MRSKIFLILAAVAALLFGLAPAASATPSITLKPGDGWTDSGNHGFCSFAAFGRDNAGRLVALTAGHCRAAQPSLVNIYKADAVAGGVIGQLTNVYKPGDYTGPFGTPKTGTLDYAVVVLDESKVAVKNEYVNVDTGVTIPVVGIDAPPNGTGNYGSNCQVGHASTDCATLGIATDQWWVRTYTAMDAGDSGGGLFIGNKLAGIGVAMTPFALPAWISTNIESVIADLNTTGSYGAGFTLYNTP
jgi:hypothetical protein